MAVKIPSKLGSMSPTFQKAWYKRNKMPLPAHLTGSVKQASKEVKPSERVKKLQAKSIQAYGATKGAKVGGEHGSGEMRDTIAPLTRDQHSKVQAAERAAKAAAKAAAPKVKKPLSKDERMAAIRRAFTKAKAKDRFDVPTVDPDDADHDDLRDVHNQMHVRGTYSEAANPAQQAAIAIAMKKAGKKPKNEEVELDEVTKQEAEKMLGGPVKTRTGSEPKGKLPLGFRRARNLARKAMKGGVDAIHRSMEKTMQKENVKESTTEVLEVNEMNHGKKLAKMIMAKQSQHPIAQNMGEENIVEQDDSMEKKEMAQTQLHFIKYAAEEILAFIDMGGEVEEWYQNKLSKVQSEVESLHSYIEGEKRRTGMVKEEEQIDEVKAVKAYDKEGKLVGRYRSMDHAKQMKPGHTYKVEEEVEQVDEKAPPGAKYERMVKHIKKGYAKGGLTPQEKSIAYATAWKAYGKKEEIEQVEEGAKDWKKAFSSVAQKNLHQDTKKMQYKVRRRDLVGLQPKVDTSPKVTATTSKRGTYSEEVVTEAEGTVAVTPKEKALAAHHGDPKKITYGDVIKARLKSAAAKKMGK